MLKSLLQRFKSIPKHFARPAMLLIPLAMIIALKLIYTSYAPPHSEGQCLILDLRTVADIGDESYPPTPGIAKILANSLELKSSEIVIAGPFGVQAGEITFEDQRKWAAIEVPCE